MQRTNKIIVNSIVLYGKIVICMLISLYSVPLVLSAVGKSDYGLYTLVGGIISMLAFMNGAMTVSTQRYLSVTIGERDRKKLMQVYNISIALHVVIGILVGILIEALLPFLFNHVLTIEPEQQGVAHLLFHTMVITMFLHIVTVPFDAAINAYEDLIFFSLAGVIEAFVKLLLVLSLTWFTDGRLMIYAVGMTGIAAIILLLKYAYCHFKYHHLRLSVKACRNRSLLMDMASFTGWNTLSSFSLMARNQGLAIVFNHFLGTIINAAYGIAMQVSGVMGYFSETIKKGINPQLMESQGLGDHTRLVSLTFALTKYSLLVLCFVLLPLFVEMPYVIRLWIGDAPDYTVEFTRIILILSLITMTSTGLMSAVQSSGRVKWYTISISIILFTTLVIAYIGLSLHSSPVRILWMACLVEVVAFFVRLWFAHRLNAIPSWAYLLRAVIPVLALTLLVGCPLVGVGYLMPPSFLRLLTVCLLDVLLFLPSCYLVILDDSERDYVRQLWKKGMKLISR